MPRLYKAKNVAKVGVNYAATGAVTAGSYFLGNPIAAAITTVLGGGFLAGTLKALKKSYGTEFEKHPAVHPDSPNLGKTVKELYEVSGLKAPEGYPVYSFTRVPQPAGKKKGFGALILDNVNKPSHAATLNASAVRLGKQTVISISDPLLKLLDDKEEKAVLAHEFAHAAARHTSVMLPSSFASVATSLNNTVTQVTALVALGWQSFLTSVAANVVAAGLFKLVTKTGKLSATKDKDLPLSQIAKKKKFKKYSRAVGTAAFAGALAFFSPACLAIVAAVKGLNTAGSLLRSSLSRTSEYHADAGAVKLGGDPLALMTALRKITAVRKDSIDELLEIEKKTIGGGVLPKSGVLTKLWNKLNATHPSLDNRIKRLSKIARKQGVSEEQIAAAAKGDLVMPKMRLPKAVLESMV